MASLFRSILRLFQAKAPGPELLDLGDDLLREILLRIGFPADVIRASAACVTFRRLVTEPSFFRRYRSLHPPLLLGFLDTKTFQPAQAPHPNAPAARALARAASFSFEDRLPRRHIVSYCIWPWEICDLREGRVLLKCRPLGFTFRVLDVLPELAVCDPLSRRRLLLPRIPDDLLASVQVQRCNIPCFEAFLVPSSTEEEDERSFRVIGMAMTDCMTKLAVFVFSSGSGRWRVGGSTNLDTLNVPSDRMMLKQPHLAHGCFFWKVEKMDELLKLDMSIMELSTCNLPPGHRKRSTAIAEAGEGRLALFSCSRSSEQTYLDHYTSILQTKSDRDNEWQMMTIIPLPANHWYEICGAADGYIFLLGFPRIRGLGPAVCLSLEVKNLKIERVCSAMPQNGVLHPYFGYPPPMSPKVIPSDEISRLSGNVISSAPRPALATPAPPVPHAPHHAACVRSGELLPAATPTPPPAPSSSPYFGERIRRPP